MNKSASAMRWSSVGAALIIAASVLGAWVSLRGPDPFTLDTWWNDTVSLGGPALVRAAEVLDAVGGGWIGIIVIPVAIAAALWITKRPWGAVYFVTASIASAILVQVFKHLFGRARPGDILVIADYGSFPSGHTANAATIGVALALLFPLVWVRIFAAAWPLLMALSRTAVHAHWLTDTIGGALMGIGAALLVAAALHTKISREQTVDTLNT